MHTILALTGVFDGTGKGPEGLWRGFRNWCGEFHQERYRVASESWEPVNQGATECIRYDVSFEDRGVPGRERDVFALRHRGIACRHPGSPDRAVTLVGTERTPPGVAPEPALDAELKPFLASLAFTAERPLAVAVERIGPRPCVSATGDGGIVATGRSGEVVLLDPSNGAALKRFTVGRNPMTALLASGALWVVDDLGLEAVVHRVDPSTGRVLGTTEAPGAQWIAAGADAVFASGFKGIYRIPLAGEGATLLRGGSFSGIAMTDGTLWVSDIGSGAVLRLDPASGTPRGPTIAVGEGPTQLAATRDAVLIVRRSREPEIVRIDPATGAIEARLPLSGYPISSCLRDGRVWVTLPRSAKLVGIDASSGQTVDEIPLPPFPTTMVCDERAIWITLGGGATEIVRLVP
jgi:streptogramin lyase